MQGFNTDNYSDDPVDINQSPQKKKLPAIFGALLLLVGGTYFVQTTLAANISINSGPVEFGQGITQAVACDSDGISVMPISTFVNASSGGSHTLTSIRLSGIDSRPGKCAGKIFVVKAYSDEGQLDLFSWEEGYSGDNPYWTETSRYNSIRIRNASTEFRWISGGTDHDDVIDVVYDSGDLTNTAFTLKLVSASVPPNIFQRKPLALAKDVKKITIETMDGTSYISELFGEGPGGGTIFYYDPAGFSCGPTLIQTCNYLEAAPTTGANAWTDVGISWATDVNGNWSNNVPGAVETVIGSGYKNSLAIEGQLGNVAGTSAAVAARGYRGPNNLSDWFLPSQEELYQLYVKKAAVGGFAQSAYWTSTQSTQSDSAMAFFFQLGYGGSGWKDLTAIVRPVRAF